MTFPERLLELIKEKRINKNQLQKELNLNKSSILNWTTRGNIPSGDTLSILANYFNVSVDYLLGNSDIKKPAISNDDELGDIDKAMLDKFKSLSAESQVKVLEYADLLRLQRDK
jgi:transcriptional regulator with XRE-family HTH domain